MQLAPTMLFSAHAHVNICLRFSGKFQHSRNLNTQEPVNPTVVEVSSTQRKNETRETDKESSLILSVPLPFLGMYELCRPSLSTVTVTKRPAPDTMALVDRTAISWSRLPCKKQVSFCHMIFMNQCHCARQI